MENKEFNSYDEFVKYIEFCEDLVFNQKTEKEVENHLKNIFLRNKKFAIQFFQNNKNYFKY